MISYGGKRKQAESGCSRYRPSYCGEFPDETGLDVLRRETNMYSVEKIYKLRARQMYFCPINFDTPSGPDGFLRACLAGGDQIVPSQGGDCVGRAISTREESERARYHNSNNINRGAASEGKSDRPKYRWNDGAGCIIFAGGSLKGDRAGSAALLYMLGKKVTR